MVRPRFCMSKEYWFDRDWGTNKEISDWCRKEFQTHIPPIYKGRVDIHSRVITPEMNFDPTVTDKVYVAVWMLRKGDGPK